MDYQKLIKKQSIFMAIYIIQIIISLILTFLGIGLLSENNNMNWLFMIVPGGIWFIVSLILMIIKGLKINKQINLSITEYIKSIFDNNNKNEEYISESGKKIIFDSLSVKIDGEEYFYNKDVSVLALFKFKKIAASKEINIILGIGNDNFEEIIPFSKNLYDDIVKYNIPVVNIDDVNYLVNNPELGAKQILKNINNNLEFCPIIFFKNKEEKKIRNKIISKQIIKLIVSLIILLIGTIGISLLLNWLKDTKIEGSLINPMNVSQIIIRSIFSIYIILCIFVLKENISLLNKITLGIFFVLFWLFNLFLPGRFQVLLYSVFAYIFSVQGYRLLPKGMHSEEDIYNRFFLLSNILILIGLISCSNLCIEKHWIAVVTGFGIALIFSLVIFIKGYNEYKKDRKNKKISNLIGFVFVVIIFFGINTYMFIVSANSAFDSSEEVVVTTEILEKNESDDYSETNVLVIVDGKERTISISEDLFEKVNIGDNIIVSIYEGAFGLKVYSIKDEYNDALS